MPCREQKASFLPFISVIVTAKDAAATVGTCLSSLVALQYPNYEVIFVDGGSTDATVSIASGFRDRIKILRERGGSPASGRNAGLREARGEIVAFLDSDAYVRCDWLSIIASRLSADEIGGVGGPAIPYDGSTTFQKVVHKALSSLMGCLRSPQYYLFHAMTSVKKLSAQNAAFRGNVMRKVNLFDESLRYCEDEDLSGRIRELGLKLIYLPELVAFHEYDRTVTRFVRRMFQYGIGRARMTSSYSWGVAASILTIAILLLLSVLEGSPLFLAVITAYTLLALATALRACLSERDIAYLGVFPLLVIEHVAYCCGFSYSCLKDLLTA